MNSGRRKIEEDFGSQERGKIKKKRARSSDFYSN